MAKFTEGFLSSLRGAGQRGSATDPRLADQMATQYGSTDPLARSVGGMFNLDMSTGAERAKKETSAIEAPAGSMEHLKKALLVQAKYAPPKEQTLIFAKLAEIEKLQQEEKARKDMITNRRKDMAELALEQGHEGFSIGIARGLWDDKPAEMAKEFNRLNQPDADKDNRTQDQLEHAQIVAEEKAAGRPVPSFRDYLQSKGSGTDGGTANQRDYAQALLDYKAQGVKPPSFTAWVDRNTSTVVTPTALQQNFEYDKQKGNLPEAINSAGLYKLWTDGKINDSGQATSVEKYEHAKDAEGFPRWTTGPNKGKYVFPDSVAEAKMLAREQKATEKSKKDNVIDFLNKEGYTEIATLLSIDALDVQGAMKQAQLDPAIIKLMSESVDKSADHRTMARGSANLLIEFNENVPMSGSLAEMGRGVERFFGSGDQRTLNIIELNKITNGEALKMLAAGSVTEREMTESKKGVPKPTDGAGVIRAWLLSNARANALGMAFEDERIKYMKGNRGDMSGFSEYFAELTSDKPDGSRSDFVTRAYNKLGIPPTSRLKRTTSQLQ